ncbi:hypothetical protein GPN2_11385 [Streptomyces murinus]
MARQTRGVRLSEPYEEEMKTWRSPRRVGMNRGYAPRP